MCYSRLYISLFEGLLGYSTYLYGMLVALDSSFCVLNCLWHLQLPSLEHSKSSEIILSENDNIPGALPSPLLALTHLISLRPGDQELS